jgi:hypothetical protein
MDEEQTDYLEMAWHSIGKALEHSALRNEALEKEWLEYARTYALISIAESLEKLSRTVFGNTITTTSVP